MKRFLLKIYAWWLEGNFFLVNIVIWKTSFSSVKHFSSQSFILLAIIHINLFFHDVFPSQATMIAFFNYVYHSPQLFFLLFLILFSSSSSWKSSNAAYLRGKKWTEWSQKLYSLRLVLYNVHIAMTPIFLYIRRRSLYNIAFSCSHKTRSETFESSFSSDVFFN